MAAAEGMVLLQNNDLTLPLSRDLRLGVFGNSSYEMVTGGSGSGDVNKAYSISLMKGLEEAGMTILGRNSGEFVDREIKRDFELSETEQLLIGAISEAFHREGKKVVVILNVGGVVETMSWRDKVDAILLAWQPGQEAGYAVADILTGKVNPSGKLATTFAMGVDDYLSSLNFPGVVLEAAELNEAGAVFAAKSAKVVYEDSVWVGYRAFARQKLEVAFPFGHGLSYTRFSYGDMQVSGTEFTDELFVCVTVTNKGLLPGREVVQLYISAPIGVLDKPVAELRAFAKTGMLMPEDSEILNFSIKTADLASFDPIGSVWTADKGKYALRIGASSADIRASAEVSLRNGIVYSCG